MSLLSCEQHSTYSKPSEQTRGRMIEKEKTNQFIRTRYKPSIDFLSFSFHSHSLSFQRAGRSPYHNAIALPLWFFTLNASLPFQKTTKEKAVSIRLKNGVTFVQEQLVADPGHCSQTGFSIKFLDVLGVFTFPPHFYFNSPNPCTMDINMEKIIIYLARFGFPGVREQRK